MRTVIVFLVAAGCFLVATPADAQVSTDVDSATIEQIKQQALNWQFGLTYSQAVSQGELRNAYDSLSMPVVGYGFAVQFAYYMDPAPVVVGGELGVHFSGTIRCRFWRTCDSSRTSEPGFIRMWKPWAEQ